MKILPAIDIRNGKCVRLTQGDYKRETIYDNNPVIMAQKWQSQGAGDLHIVDLDGAREGKLDNLDIITEIVKGTDLSVQIGGGIRTIESAQSLFQVGVSRIILGTIALEDKKLLKIFIDKFGEKIIISLDVKNNTLAKKGWIEPSLEKLIPKAKEMEQMGVNTIIYTDIERDGMLTEPNFLNISKLRNAVRLSLFVAGGVTSADQVEILKRIKVDGVIIGKALYEETINFNDLVK